MPWPFEIPTDQGGGGTDPASLERLSDLWRTLGMSGMGMRQGGGAPTGQMTPADWFRFMTPFLQGQRPSQQAGSPQTPTAARPGGTSVLSQYQFGAPIGPVQAPQTPPGPPLQVPSVPPRLFGPSPYPPQPQVPSLGPVNPSALPGSPQQVPDLGPVDPWTLPGVATPHPPTPTGQGGVNWGQLGGTVAPLLLSLFASNPYTGKTAAGADQLASLAMGLGGEGQQISGLGIGALAPVLQYLNALAGGDPVALQQATMPEQRRVLEQYDTARKSLQFAPRGGGQAGALMQAGAQQASDVSNLVASARAAGVSSLGQLGKGLLSEGLTEEREAARALTDSINAYAGLSANRSQQLAGFGSALGAALPSIIAAL